MQTTPPWFVLGAGAIGTFTCQRLHEVDIEAQLLHHRTGQEERVLTRDGTRYRVPAAALDQQPSGSIRRLIITCKAGQVAHALHQAAPRLAATAVVVTTANGIGFERLLAERAPDHTVFRAVSTAAAYRNSKTEVVAAALGTTRIGGIALEPTPPEWFADSLARLEGWRWESPISGAVAEKFSINCAVNALTATLGCRNGELLREAPQKSAGGAASGSRLESRAGPELAALCRESEPALRQLGLWQGSRSLADVAVDVCQTTHGNRSSMLQDVLAGRPTEIEFLNAELLRQAAQLPLDLPINRQLVRELQAGVN